MLRTTYSNSTWQNSTFDAARAVARGDRGRLADSACGSVCSATRTRRRRNGDVIPKAALQYIENHDHERFLCNFGTHNPDEAGNPLFPEGDRSRWYMLQPYLIASSMSKGIPMLWQGEEFAENYFLPDFGAGRVSLLRPLRWDFFYDDSGQADRQPRSQAAAHPASARRTSAAGRTSSSTTGIGISRAACCCSLATTAPGTRWSRVNIGDTDQTVPFWFPIAGDYVEELHGGALDLRNRSGAAAGRADDPLALRPDLDERLKRVRRRLSLPCGRKAVARAGIPCVSAVRPSPP